MNAVDSSPAQDGSDVETRIFRRGVSDQEVRQAIELIREYIATQWQNQGDEIQWWSGFSDVYDDLSRNFTPQQTGAFEIAADTILVSFGCPRWSRARQGLRVVLRSGALDQSTA